MLRLGLAGSLFGLALSMSSPTLGQSSGSDLDAAQVVALFQQSCMRYAGDAAELRSWASAHHLRRVPVEQAAIFLGSIGAGEVYGASNATGKHALVLYGSGSCQIIAMTGMASIIKRSLLDLLHGEGVVVSPLLVRSNQEGGIEQELFEAALGARRWKISITSKPHLDAPNLAPEVHLLATNG